MRFTKTSQEHEELRANIREWAEREIKPIAFMLDQNNEFPREQIRDFASMGYLGLPYPTEYGGMGKDVLSYAIAVEELSRVDGGRIGIAAQALGIAQGAYEAAVEYAKEREQFNAPIAQLQAIQFKIAEMATKLRAARFLVYSAAELKEHHEPYGMEAAMAKKYASDVCLEIVNDALQIFGGSGYLKGMAVERAYRDAKICTIYEGTNEIQNVVIASNILGKAAKSSSAPAKSKPKTAVTGARKKMLLKDGTAKEKVDTLVAALKADGHDFSVGIDIDTNANAPIFKNADYGIVGDVNEILPLLTEALDDGKPKKPAPPMVKMKRAVPEEPKPAPVGRYVCLGCGYEYIPEKGDESGDIRPGTSYKNLPEEWTCPDCGEIKANFIPA